MTSALLALRRHRRKQLPRVAGWAACLVLTGAALGAQATPSSPFRRAALPGDPFRVAQAEPAPAEPAATTPAPAEPAPASATSTPVAKPAEASGACREDRECPTGTVCEGGTCRPFERATNVLLFRKEGGSTAFIPFYWAHRGNPGYRVVAPFYWHFWGPESRTRIVAPFYWHVVDHTKQSSTTVIVPGLPISWSSQPGASSFGVWPIVYRSTKFGWAAPLLGSFTIKNPDEQRAFGALAFLYWWKRSEPGGKAFDLLFPLFVSSRSRSHEFTFALPLNFSWRSGDHHHLLALPIAYASSGPRSGFAVTPLGYVSRREQAGSGSLAWLYYYGRDRANGREHDVLFPLVWSFRSPSASTTVAGPVVHARRGDWSLSALVPIGLRVRDRAAGTAFGFLLPFAVWRTTDHDRRTLLVSPLGGYSRTDETSRFVLLAPPVFRDRRPGVAFDMVALLYWRYRNQPNGVDALVLGPWYQRRDPAGVTRTLFPLYWHFRDHAAQAETTAVLPFYVGRRAPDERTTAVGIFPLLGYHRTFAPTSAGGGGSTFGLFPLAFFGHRGERRHAVVFPLLFHGSDARSSHTVVFPFFYRASDQAGHVAGVPPLLYFQGGDRNGSYHVQIPFFWRLKDERTGETTTVVPPAFWKRKPTGWSAGLVPLLFAGRTNETSHVVVAPLFWRFTNERKQERTTVVLNYLHRTRGGETTDAFLPLLWYRRGPRPGGTDETSFTLLPLAHYRRNARATTFLSPLAMWRRRADGSKAGFAGLYAWMESPTTSAQGLFPLWWDVTRKDRGERTRIFGPYFAIDRWGADAGAGERARVLFPLVARFEDENATGTWVLPTYFRRRGKDGLAIDSLLPLFWWSRTADSDTKVVGPWFSSHGPDRRSHGFVPLYVWSRNPERTLFVSPLAYHRRDHAEGTSFTTAALLFWRNTAPTSDSTVFLPLWFSTHNGPRTRQVLFPLYWRFSDADTRKSFSLAGPFFARGNGDTYRRGLLPIAWYTRNPVSGFQSHAVLPFFYESHGAGQRKVLTALFGWGHASDESRFWYALPYFQRETVTNRFAMLAPLWFRAHDKTAERTTQLIPPLLHFYRGDPERSLSVWLGLFWRHRTVDSATTVLLPLYYDTHTFHGSRTTALVPLFVRHRNDAERTTWTLAPLFYRRSGPEDATTVLFPLLWDFRGTERRTTVLFPFYVGVNRATYKASYVFPIFYYRRGLGEAEGTYRFMAFPFWESAAKRPGDRMWEVLLGLVGYERIGRNRFLKLFFIPFELEPAPRAQTAWYGRTPPPRRTVRDTRAALW